MKEGHIRVKVPVDQLRTKLQEELVTIVGDRKAKLETNKIFCEMCNKYVPRETGALQESGHATEVSVIWDTPYAHYMYEGIIYGPNIPIYDENGIAVAWYSPPGEKTKYNTGRRMKYHVNGNPLAARHWDKVMLNRDRRVFNYRVSRKLQKIAGGKK